MRHVGIRISVMALVAWLALAGCASTKTSKSSEVASTATSTTASSVPKTAAAPAGPQEVTLPDGLKYTDVKVGDGAIAENGLDVSVHYTGTLTDGTQFDSSVGGQPLSFRLGAGQVIRGWDEGIKGMRIGGKRKLIVPASLGYGDRGTPGGPIPPNATLLFDIELLGLR